MIVCRKTPENLRQVLFGGPMSVLALRSGQWLADMGSIAASLIFDTYRAGPAIGGSQVLSAIGASAVLGGNIALYRAWLTDLRDR
jgi:hypothetical protein